MLRIALAYNETRFHAHLENTESPAGKRSADGAICWSCLNCLSAATQAYQHSCVTEKIDALKFNIQEERALALASQRK